MIEMHEKDTPMTYPSNPTASTRRAWLATAMPLLAAGALPFAVKAASPTPVEVWKDPNCGCCQDWVDHMQANGFAVKVHDTGNNAVRALLKQKPKALGLAVPGMPVGSPGMDGAVYGDRRDPYDVLLVARDGSTRVFKQYNQKAS